MEHNKKQSFGQFGIGSFILLIGIALLFDKLDILDTRPLWHYWPIIFLAIGLGNFMDARSAREYRKASWWLFMGSWLLVSELRLFGLNYHNSWPILLIGFGGGILWKSAYPLHVKFSKDHCHGI